jgi:hypothetical protein
MMTNGILRKLGCATGWCMAGCMLGALPVRGAWTLVDDHESGLLWTRGTIAVDPADPANHAFTTNGASGGPEERTLPAAVADGTQATLFARFHVETGQSPNIAFRFDLASSDDYGNAPFCVMPDSPPNMRGVGQAGETGGSDASWVRDTWVPFWVVIDNSAHTFNVHVGADPAAPRLADPVPVFGSDLAMRTSYLGDITKLAFQGWSSGSIYIDDIYLDTTGPNLTNPLVPIPEPHTLALALTGGALLGRRRKLRRMM